MLASEKKKEQPTRTPIAELESEKVVEVGWLKKKKKDKEKEVVA